MIGEYLETIGYPGYNIDIERFTTSRFSALAKAERLETDLPPLPRPEEFEHIGQGNVHAFRTELENQYVVDIIYYYGEWRMAIKDYLDILLEERNVVIPGNMYKELAQFAYEFGHASGVVGDDGVISMDPKVIENLNNDWNTRFAAEVSTRPPAQPLQSRTIPDARTR